MTNQLVDYVKGILETLMEQVIVDINAEAATAGVNGSDSVIIAEDVENALERILDRRNLLKSDLWETAWAEARQNTHLIRQVPWNSDQTSSSREQWIFADEEEKKEAKVDTDSSEQPEVDQSEQSFSP